jgi:PAS domain S-box-containing protein
MAANEKLKNLPAGNLTRNTYTYLESLVRPALWVLVIVVALTVILAFANITSTFDPPNLVTALDFVFIVIPAVVIITISVRSFSETGIWASLWLGAGTLLFACASLGGPIFLAASTVNNTVTFHNCVMFFSSVMFLAGAFFSLIKIPSLSGQMERRASLLLIYIGAAAFVIFVAMVTAMRQMPEFFSPGLGGTPIRQLIVGTTALLFLAAAAGTWQEYRRARSPVVYWYSLGLGMLVLGMIGLLLQTGTGTPLNWAGRIAQMLSGIYFLAAALVAVREGRLANVSPEESLAKELNLSQRALHDSETERKKTEEKLTKANTLQETLLTGAPIGFAFLDLDLNYIMVNDWMAKLNSRSIEKHVGKNVAEVAPAILPVVHKLSSQILETGQPIKDFEFKTEPGASGTELKYWSQSWYPVKDAGGKTTGFGVFLEDITERKKAEEAARESEERLHFALESSHTGAWDLDLVDHTAIRTVEHDRIFGYSELLPEWTYEMFLDHVLPEDRQAVDAKFRKAMETKGDWNFECRIRHPDGTVRWIWAVGKHYIEPTGDARRMAGIVQDITEKKTADAALRDSEARLRLIARAARIGFFEWNATKDTAYWSPEHYELFGFDPHSPITWQSWLLGVHPDDKERLAKNAARQLERALSGETGTHEIDRYRYSRSDGTTVWIETESSVEITDGEAVFRGSVRDITERKKAEEQLRESEARFRLALTNAPVSVSIQDLDLRFLWAYNQRTVDPKSVIGKTDSDLFPPNDAARLKSLKLKVMETGQPIHEQAWITSNGQRKFLDLYIEPTRDSNQAITGVGIATVDITHLKQIEMLKDEFIGMISHELKTPLTVIIGALSTAVAPGLNEDLKKQLFADAVNHSEIMASIVDNLLELSRQQSNRLDLRKKPTDIGQVAHKVVDQLRKKSDIHTLAWDFPEDLPKVPADALRVERIIYNLVENAIKYSPAGGEVKTFGKVVGGFLQVGVADQGLGISTEDQKRLFQSFERLGYDVKGAIKGTGLGLKVSRILAEAHGGRIWVESEFGKGSTFYFTLPIGN